MPASRRSAQSSRIAPKRIASAAAQPKSSTKTSAVKSSGKRVIAKTPAKKVPAQKTPAKRTPVKTTSSKTTSSKTVPQKKPGPSKSRAVSVSAAEKTAIKASPKASAKPARTKSGSAKASITPSSDKKVILKKHQGDTNPPSPIPGKSTGATVARAIFRDKPVPAPKPAVVLPPALPPGESAPNLILENDPGFLDASEVFDEAEHAQHQQLREQAAIQERARQMARPETHPDFDGAHCVECGDDMPEFRLKIGRVRCVECQQVLEERARRQGGSPASSGPRLPEDWQM